MTVGNFYECEATIVAVGDPRIVERINANHFPGKRNADVNGILFKSQHMPLFPRRIEKSFPNIQVITVFNTTLREISRDDIRPFADLRDLDLTSNNIQSITSDLFEDNNKVRSVTLHFNPLKHVGHQAFEKLPELRILHLRNTTCQNRFALTRQASLQIIHHLFLDCPPSSQMIQVEVLRDIKESIRLLKENMGSTG